jgi:hypothetical protein
MKDADKTTMVNDRMQSLLDGLEADGRLTRREVSLMRVVLELAKTADSGDHWTNYAKQAILEVVFSVK